MDIDTEIREVVEAEDKVASILRELEETVGRRIEWVRVDTRNFAGCSVEIAMQKPAKSAAR